MTSSFNSNFKRLSGLILALIFTVSALMAEVPGAPRFLEIQGNLNRLMLGFSINLQKGEPEGLHLYGAPGETQDISAFDKIQSFPIFEKREGLKDGDSMFIFIEIDNFISGQLTFYLTQYNDDGESEPSNFITIYIKGPHDDYVHFTSQAERTTMLNEEYVYEAHAEGPPDLTINYKLIKGPEGMTIDAETGILTWTPTQAGMYDITIQAYTLEDEYQSDYQNWPLWVTKCTHENAPILTGTITDQDGNPISFGMANAYRVVDKDVNNCQFWYNARFVDGQLYLPLLDEGDYIVYFEGPDFYQTWYDGTYRQEDAKIISVTCGQTVNIDMKVDVFSNHNLHTVSGTVTRASDGSAVPYSLVDFKGSLEEVNSKYVVEYSVLTDMNGFYTLELPDKFEYIAYCIPGDTTYFGDMNLLPQFYDRVSSPPEATVIKLSGDRDDINFVLEERPGSHNKLSGIVKDADGVPLKDVCVIGFLVQTDPLNEESLFLSRAALTDETGLFEFTELIPGDYVLFAFPLNPEIIPGFYKDNETTVPSWVEATRIAVPESGDAGNYVIKLKNRQKVEGSGGVRGSITKRKGSIKIEGNSPLGNDPLSGAFIYAINANGYIVNYSGTNNNGSFEINGLGKGTYTIVADKVGYEPYSVNVELGEDNEFVDKYIEMGKKTTAVDIEVGTSVVEKAYPNPTNGNVNISFAGAAGTTEVSVLDVKGKVLYSGKIQTNAGANLFNFNAGNLSDGLYFAKFVSGANWSVVPFTVLK